MTESSFGFEIEEMPDNKYRVYLPHQCDVWEITNNCDGVSYMEARIQVRRFIDEATKIFYELADLNEIRRENK